LYLLDPDIIPADAPAKRDTVARISIVGR